MTQRELAAQIGVANTTISNWEKNASRPDPDLIELLCGILEISPSWLFGETESESQVPPGFQPLPETELLPRVGQIACGEPILAEQNIEDCAGASMVPRILDGAVVAIRKQPSVENGEIAAVRIGDEATLKHVYYSPDKLILQPENPAFPPIVLIGEEMNTAIIEGKAVGLCRKI